jgi:hypothetical protein
VLVLAQLQLHVFAAILWRDRGLHRRAAVRLPRPNRSRRAAAAQVRVALARCCEARARARAALPLGARTPCSTRWRRRCQRQRSTHPWLEAGSAPGKRFAHAALQLHSFSQKLPSALQQHDAAHGPSQLQGLNCDQTCEAWA